MREQRRALAALCLLGLALVSMVVVFSVEPQRQKPGHKHNDAGIAPSAAPQRFRASSPMHRVAVATSRPLVDLAEHALVRVLDEVSLPPCRGAIVARAERSQRIVREADVLGRTDQDGLVTIAMQTNGHGQPTPIASVVISLDGYVPHLIGSLESGNDYEIRLSHGEHLDLTIRDTQRRPLAGVAVVASGDFAVVRNEAEASTAPGYDPRVNRLAVVTDSEGRARLSGILTDMLYLFVSHPTHIISRDSVNHCTQVSMPSPPLEITMECPLVAAWEYRNDQVLHSGYEAAGSRLVPPNALPVTRRFPSATFVFMSGTKTGGGSVTARALLARTGTREDVVPLVRLDEFVAPVPIDLAGVVESRTLGEVRVQLVEPWEGVDPLLLARAKQDAVRHSRPPARFRLSIGESVRMPAGTYEIVSQRDLIVGAPSITVEPGARRDIMVTMLQDRVHVTAAVTSEWGGLVRGAKILVQRGTQRIGVYPCDDKGECSLFLARAEYRMTASAAGFQAHDMDLDLTKASLRSNIPVSLVLAR